MPDADPRYAHCPECAGGRVDCQVCDGEGIVTETRQLDHRRDGYEAAHYIELGDLQRDARSARVDWGQPVGDVPVDRYFGVVATPGPLCGDFAHGCRHASCACIAWPARWITGLARG